MDFKEVPRLSLSVIEKGEIVRNESYGLFHACSMSKFVTTMAVLKLVNLGILDLDDDVNNRLKSWKVPQNKFVEERKVTLRHLLSHQGGFRDTEGSFGIYNPADGYPNIIDILEGRTNYHQKPVEAQYVPGTEFEYSDAGFCIVEQLLMDIMDKSFSDLMKELVLEPLGMDNSFFLYPQHIDKKHTLACGHDKDGNVVEGKRAVYPYLAAAGLWSTPKDLSKLILELFNGLKGEGKLGITKEILQDMISPQGEFQGAGLGTFVTKTAERTQITSQGWGIGFQCMLSAIPETGQGAVVMMNSEPGKPQDNSIIGETLRQIRSEYNWPMKVVFFS